MTPADFVIGHFVDVQMLLPWIFGIPLVFLILLTHCNSNIRDRIAFAGQLFQALGLPYLIAHIAIGIGITTVAISTENFFQMHRIGGYILGWVVPPGIILGLAYLINRHAGDVSLSKPISKLKAALLIVVPWGVISFVNLKGYTGAFFGFDNVLLLFTPASFLVLYILNREFPRPLAHSLADIAVINSLFYVIIALVYWLYGASESEESFYLMLRLGCWGLYIGPSIYQAAYLWSLTNPQEKAVEIRTKNWHFLEIATVFYFFIFAPESVSSVVNQKQNIEQNNRILSEVRAIENKTLIAVDDVIFHPDTTGVVSGLICIEVSNTGQAKASQIKVDFESVLNNYKLEEMFGHSVYLTVSKIELSRLEIGQSLRACGQYALLHSLKNQPFNYPIRPSDYIGEENWPTWIESMTYTLSYDEDRVVRPDYRRTILLGVNGKLTTR